MTNDVFFDTDGISAFMWVGETNIIVELYGGNIVFPGEVYRELSNPKTPHLKGKADQLIKAGYARIETIEVGSSAYIVLKGLNTDINGPMIGKGESAAIALAYTQHGIMASNNLKDISPYIKKYGIINITSLDILKEAERQGIINDSNAESIWRAMKVSGMLLPSGTYAENRGDL